MDVETLDILACRFPADDCVGAGSIEGNEPGGDPDSPLLDVKMTNGLGIRIAGQANLRPVGLVTTRVGEVTCPQWMDNRKSGFPETGMVACQLCHK